MHVGAETRGGRLHQRDNPGAERLPYDVEQQHRPRRRSPPLGRAAGIEYPDAAELLGLRYVRVSVHDGFAVREPRAQPRLTAYGGPWDVYEPDVRILDADDALARERFLQRRLVHVPVDRGDRSDRLELLEDAARDEVAAVDDQVGGSQQLQAGIGQPPRTAREMRVRDDRDPRQPRPFRKAPSR
jgi:hypothetical protein